MIVRLSLAEARVALQLISASLIPLHRLKKKFAVERQTLNKHEDIKREYKKNFLFSPYLSIYDSYSSIQLLNLIPVLI